MKLVDLDILNRFKTISLAEMGEVALMTRRDRKFIFHKKVLSSVLESLPSKYDLLTIDSLPFSAYKSSYYDTPGFDLYLDHQRGKLNRYKFRFRNYLGTNTQFFEIKYRSSKGVTRKTRLEIQPGQAETDLIDNFMIQHSPFRLDKLEEKLSVNYSRITLVDKARTERVTLDFGLEFVNQNSRKNFENLIVAEVKQLKITPSFFVDEMKKKRIREGAISKYCQAVYNLYPHLKANNFKFFKLNILKLTQDIQR